LLTTRLPENAQRQLYDKVNAHPVPVFFHNIPHKDPPEIHKEGFLKKQGAIIRFSAKNQRYFSIEGRILKYYNDQTKSEVLGEITLAGASIEKVAATKKEPNHLIIKVPKGQPIGYKITKGMRKQINKSEYVAYGTEAEIFQWYNALNFITFFVCFFKEGYISSNE